jgi:hypothetical protein
MRSILVLAAFVAVLAPGTSGAQVRYRVDDPGRWRPWEFTAVASVRRDRAATPAEVRAFEARLVELNQILKRAPAVAQPVGFAAGTSGSMTGYAGTVSGWPPGRALPLAGGLTFGAFSLFENDRNGRTIVEEGIATEQLYFEINQIEAYVYGAQKPLEWGPIDTGAFIEPPAGAAVAGFPRVGITFVIKKNPKPLWVPFPLGEALQPIVAPRREAFEQERAVYDKQVAEFAAWQTPAARAARRAEWQKAAATMPNGAEFVKNMEKADPEIETGMKARLAPNGPAARSLATAEREWREAEAALSALSAGLRAAAACYDSQASTLAARIRALDGAPSSCRAIVTPNWDYFDAKLPRSAPQVLMLGLFTRCVSTESLKATHPSGCVVNRKLVETLDWDAVRAWLDR